MIVSVYDGFIGMQSHVKLRSSLSHTLCKKWEDSHLQPPRLVSMPREIIKDKYSTIWLMHAIWKCQTDKSREENGGYQGDKDDEEMLAKEDNISNKQEEKFPEI